jgi:hypothetical protein
VDVLGWLHVIWGAFGTLAGLSLLVLAAGTSGALWRLPESGPAERAAVWILFGCGLLLVLAGLTMALAGRALRGRQPKARLTVLLLSPFNLVVAPFGTALAIYACWVLLNDDARHQFGRAPRGPAALESLERA